MECGGTVESSPHDEIQRMCNATPVDVSSFLTASGMDRAGKEMLTYDLDPAAMWKVFETGGLQDLHRLCHPNASDLSFVRQSQGVSRIDGIWAFTELIRWDPGGVPSIRSLSLIHI